MDKNNMTTNKTRVRYAVHFNDRNYEYVLHSQKRYFLKRIADVINVLEFCVTQEWKKNGITDNLWNFEVIRMVNDVPQTDEKNAILENIKGILQQSLADSIAQSR